MIKNYFKLAYRNLLSNKLVSGINIFGLSIAIGCCITIFLFLQNHWTMDNFHANGERIFIAEYVVENSGETQVWGTSPMPLGPALANDFPQVERAVRIELQGCRVYSEDRMFEELVYFADTGYFDMFTFPLKSGSAAALNEPNAVILSAATADKFFPGQNALGKEMIILFDNTERRIVTVRGVAAPFPDNAGIKFDILTGFTTLETLTPEALTDWATHTRGTFVQLRQPADAAYIAAHMQEYIALHNAANEEVQIQSFVFDNLRYPNPEAYKVYRRPAHAMHPLMTLVFAAMALMMMALSCFNYINIALGYAGKRFKEIGVRKVIGGNKRQLIGQFMSENLLICLLALLFGLALAEGAFIPVLNSIMVVKTSVSFTGNPALWVFLVSLLVFTAIASGAYPSFFISSLKPAAIFSNRQSFKRNSKLPRLFLALQFVLTLCMIIAGVALMKAGSYWEKLPWGYQPEQTVVLRLDNAAQFHLLKNEIEKSPYIVGTAGAANHIGESLQREQVLIEQEKHEVYRYDVGTAYFETMGLPLLQGQIFDHYRRPEDATTVIVNQTFANERRWALPVGQQIRTAEKTYTVIGVVADFKVIGSGANLPVVFFPAEESRYAYLLMRYTAGAAEKVEAHVKSVWQSLYPEIPVSYFQQAQVFDNFYHSYDNATTVFNYLAGLALVIACLGLFGLASQNYASRLKEVSIRKILGASVPDIVFIANRRFVIILLVASLVATTLSALGIHFLLDATKEFTGSLRLGIMPYLLANVMVFLTAAIAIGGQTYKLARISPAETLRNE